MSCKCGSERIASIIAKSNDCNAITIGDDEYMGYIPYEFGIGGGDQVEFSWCLDCGQIQGNFPILVPNLKDR